MLIHYGLYLKMNICKTNVLILENMDYQSVLSCFEKNPCRAVSSFAAYLLRGGIQRTAH